jgi:hypothetical protein
MTGRRLYGFRSRWFRVAGLAPSAALLSVCILHGSGCASDRSANPILHSAPNRATAADLRSPKAVEALGAPPPGASPERSDRHPPAMLNGEPIAWSALTPALAEAAGGAILEETCLDRLLDREMALRTLTLDAGALDAEKALLVESLVRDAGAPADQAATLIDSLRRSRGLGEARFGALLQRNACLRRLVRDEVRVTPDDLQQAYQIRYGPRFRVRLIIVRTEREAAAARERVVGSGANAPEPFAEVAQAVSADPSAARGGLIAPISPADPSYPEAVRNVLPGLGAGEVSPVLALDRGYAVLKVEEQIQPSGEDFSTVAPDLEREVRLVRERAQMDRLAGRLLGAASVTAFDPSLDWSWRTRRQPQRP